MTKAEARLAAKAAVLKMSSDEKELASGAICDALSGLQEFKGAHSVFVYLGTETEPATDEIVGLALMLERTVAVPRVRGKEMDAVVISPFTNFKTTVRRIGWSLPKEMAKSEYHTACSYYSKFVQQHLIMLFKTAPVTSLFCHAMSE